MSWRINFLILVVFSWACQKETQVVIPNHNEGNLIEAAELKAIINQPNIKLLDFRKKDEYDKGHINRALNIWRTDIEDSSYPYRGMMPSKSQIEDVFGHLGINSNDTIIVYDDNGMCEAARLWWVLQNYDFKNVRILNGGISAWTLNNGSLTTQKVKFKPSAFELSDNPSMAYHISKEELEQALKSEVTIIDTRTLDEYTGKHRKNGAAKSGRIPESLHMDWAESINYNGDQRFKTIEEIKKKYRKLNIKKTDLIVLYCHTGVRSAHSTFVLTQLLGHQNVKNYDGSWVEWSYFNNLPFENDQVSLIKK
jgi:thiosulfate/3-mercaptopyruvate sulfurtransferase